VCWAHALIASWPVEVKVEGGLLLADVGASWLEDASGNRLYAAVVASAGPVN
jgi:hypothetical protein